MRAFATATTNLPRLFETVSSHVATDLDAYCIVLIRTADGLALEPTAVHYRDEAAAAAVRALFSTAFPLADHPITSRVLTSGKPLVASSIDYERLRSKTTPAFFEHLRGIGMHSLLIVPLTLRELSLGVLVLARGAREPTPFDTDDVHLAENLAGHAALAIGNARAYATAEEARCTAERAREDLRASEEAFRHLFEASPLAKFIFDVDSLEILAVNDAALALYGYDQAEFTKLRLTDLRHPDDAPELDRLLRAAANESLRTGGRHVRKDGTTFFMEGGSHVTHYGGRSVRSVHVVDVTEQKVAEEALRRAEARFAGLATSGIIGIITTDLDARVLDVNDAALDIIGYSREEVLAPDFRWSKLTPPEWSFDTDDLRESSVTKAREKEYLRKDGTRVPVLTGATRIDARGAGECIAFLLDLRERRWASAAIEHLREARASEAKFRRFLESAPDAVLITDADGKIVHVNLQAENLFGYKRSELLDQSVDLLVPARYRTDHPDNRARYLAAPRPRAMGSGLELYGLRRDGSEFPVEISLSPLDTPDGVLVASAIRDISERKQTETALRVANRELEAFSYSVAHDLRAPLRGMNGFAQLLLDEYGAKLDEEGKDWLREIVQNARKMGLLIDALLALARVSRTELRRQDLDLSQIVETEIAALAAAEPSHHVTTSVERGLHVSADPSLARALVQNLVSNAWKFTHNRRDATITFGVVERKGQRAFFLQDNGAGFDMTYASKLFVPFQRLHSASEFPGTGIGLATVQRIVHRHGGAITAESAVGAGATFYFTFAADGHSPAVTSP